MGVDSGAGEAQPTTTAPSAPPSEVVPPTAPVIPQEEIAVAAQPLATAAEAASPELIYVQASSCSVAVTDLSGNVTKEMLEDFMTFCGEVKCIVIKPDSQQQGKFLAVVTFTDAAAVDDVLLLSGAVIGDSRIQISEVKVVDSGPDKFDRVMLQARSAQQTVQQVIQAGYIRGEALAKEIKTKAVALDEQHKISHSAREAKIPDRARAVVGTVENLGKEFYLKLTKGKETSEEEARKYQEAGHRQWCPNSVSSQPQW